MWKAFLILMVVVSACSHVNRQVPDFAAVTLSGDTVRASDFRGKNLVINIWATWCGPCVAEIDDLNHIADRYANDTNIVFLAITDDNAEKIRAFNNRKPFSYIQTADSEEAKNLFHLGPVKTIPRHVIVNRQGLVVYDKTGIRTDLEQAIAGLME